MDFPWGLPKVDVASSNLVARSHEAASMKRIIFGLVASIVLAAPACSPKAPPPPAPSPDAPAAIRRDKPADYAERFTVELVHKPAPTAACRNAADLKACRDGAHWKIVSWSGDLTADAALASCLKEDAASKRGEDPKSPKLTERRLRIAGDPSAPWTLVERVMLAARSAGFYKVDWLVPEADPNHPRFGLWLPKDRGLARPDTNPAALDPIRVRVDWSGRAVSFRFGERPAARDMDELLQSVKDARGLYFKAGISDVAIRIEPSPDAPWVEVARLVSTLRRETIERYDFVPSGGSSDALPCIHADEDD